MKDQARDGIVELHHTNKPKGALPFTSSITQNSKYRSFLMTYAKNHGVSQMSRKYNRSRSYRYVWLIRCDDGVESLKPKPKRPNHHPNQPTEA